MESVEVEAANTEKTEEAAAEAEEAAAEASKGAKAAKRGESNGAKTMGKVSRLSVYPGAVSPACELARAHACVCACVRACVHAYIRVGVRVGVLVCEVVLRGMCTGWWTIVSRTVCLPADKPPCHVPYVYWRTDHRVTYRM